MKSSFAFLLFFLSVTASAQAYFPSFNTLFLNGDADESLFSSDLNYFREELKVISKTLYIGDLQTSSSSFKNTTSSFYGFKIIPTRVLEYNFLNSGIFLKFNVNEKEKHASFPVAFEEFIDEQEEEKKGSGRIDFTPTDISLLFDQKFINQSSTSTSRVEFKVKKLEYKIDKNNLAIELKGDFTTDITIKGKKIKKEVISLLVLNADKNKFTISYTDKVSKKKIFIAEKKI